MDKLLHDAFKHLCKKHDAFLSKGIFIELERAFHRIIFSNALELNHRSLRSCFGLQNLKYIKICSYGMIGEFECKTRLVLAHCMILVKYFMLIIAVHHL